MLVVGVLVQPVGLGIRHDGRYAARGCRQIVRRVLDHLAELAGYRPCRVLQAAGHFSTSCLGAWLNAPRCPGSLPHVEPGRSHARFWNALPNLMKGWGRGVRSPHPSRVIGLAR